MGWMLWKQRPEDVGKADITDLDADWLIRLQHRLYVPIFLSVGVVLPLLTAGLGWGDWAGGFFYAVIMRMVIIHHSTFCVNSLAHYLGDRSHSDLQTACDSLITALLTYGEGFHSYHHLHEYDYRNGIKWYHYDPTKWMIRLLSFFGLTYNLRTAPPEEVAKAQLQVRLGKAREEWNTMRLSKGTLPSWSWDRIRRASAEDGRCVVVVAEHVYDVTEFLDLHPGGRKLLSLEAGKDVTGLFRGETGLHIHTEMAVGMLRRYLIASLEHAAA
jgi:stearoyl-CoA desaturase (Delta-9 desaturase)